MPTYLLRVGSEREVGPDPAPIDGDARAVVCTRGGLLGRIRVAHPDLATVLVQLRGPPLRVPIAAAERHPAKAARLLLLRQLHAVRLTGTRLVKGSRAGPCVLG